MKVIIFSDDALKRNGGISARNVHFDLQRSINLWLQEHLTIEVLHVTQSVVVINAGKIYESTVLTYTIMYR
jgi:hypothetical protein